MRALKAKNINLAERLAESKNKRPGQGRSAARLILPVAGLLLIIGGAMCWLWLKLIPELVLANRDTLAYVSDAANLQAYNEALSLTGELDALQSQRGALQLALEYLDGYPELDRDIYAILADAAEATPVMLVALDYQRDSGALTVTGLTNGSKLSADFAERLRLHGSFLHIAYYGYQLGDGSYQFILTCLLPGAATPTGEGGAA